VNLGKLKNSLKKTGRDLINKLEIGKLKKAI